MTAEQWAQAEAERQRQAEMVQTLINEVRRLGTEQNNNLQEIWRLRAEQLLTVPQVEPSEGADTPPQATPAGRGIIDTRIGKPLLFSGDESTWEDWSFKLRSYVSVVDLQLARMMEAAELAAHANTFEPRHGRTAQVLALHVDKRTRTADHPTTAKRSTGIPRSQARSLAPLQEIMHFDFGQEPAGVTDRMIVFERLVGDYQTSSGEALGVQVRCAVLLERVPPELRTHLWFTTGLRHHETDSGKLLSRETVMAAKPFNANGRSVNGKRRCVRR